MEHIILRQEDDLMIFNVCSSTSCDSRRAIGRECASVARGALLSLLGVTALAALPFTSQPARAATPTIQFTDSCPLPPPGAPYGPDGQLCAMVEVPLDYRNPSGRQISVAVSRIPAAKPSARRGVLFLNPGGPGGNQALDLPRIFTFLFA